MAALVVYESVFGNTHEVADAVGRGLSGFGVVKVVSVSEATAEVLESADLLVVGGPTHAHGMVRHASAATAVNRADADGLDLDAAAHGQILRDWFDRIPRAAGTPAAAFDTRMDVNPHLSGRASRGIAKRLKSNRFNLVASPESFLVDRGDQLIPGELERAESWGRDVLSRVRTLV